jgi:hypothetical protein
MCVGVCVGQVTHLMLIPWPVCDLSRHGAHACDFWFCCLGLTWGMVALGCPIAVHVLELGLPGPRVSIKSIGRHPAGPDMRRTRLKRT